MRIGKITGLIVCLLFFSVLSLPITWAEDYSEGPSQKPPNIRIAGDRWMPVFKAGEKINLNIPLENIGSEATDVQVSLVVGESDKFPFKTDKMSFTKYLPGMSNGTRLVTFDLIIPSTTKPGTYPVTINVSYSSNSGAGGTASGTLYVKVVNDLRQPTLTLLSVEPAHGRLPAGKSGLVKLLIKNEGDLPVKDAEVTISGFANGLGLDNGSDTQILGDMTAGAVKSVSYPINVDSETKTGTYTLDLNFSYKDDNNQEYKKTSKVFLPVAGKDSSDTMTPRIIIDNYNYGGVDHVVAGQTFTLTMSLANMSEQTEVNNIKLSLSSDGQVFTPVGSGSTLFIRAIKPGERVQKSITLKAKETAEAQTFTISADMDYQDPAGGKYTDKEILSVPVAQTIQLLIQNAKTPMDAMQGSSVSISADFYNTGRAALKNMRIHTEGDFQVQDGDLFLGTVEPGKSDYYDVTIIPNKTGEVKGQIIFEYDDSIGQHYQNVKDFKLMVQKAMPMLPGNDMQPPVQPPAKFAFKWWMVPAALALLAVPGFIFYRRRKKIKEEKFLDE